MYERKPVPGYPRMEVDSDGEMYRDGKHVLGWLTGKPKYVAIYTGKDGGTVKRAVLVALAFHGPKPEDKEMVAHKNDVHIDDRPENVYWATRGENKLDSIRNGSAPGACGDANGNSRFRRALRSVG